MAKRVSLKGKGADLFFGDYGPPPAERHADRRPRHGRAVRSARPDDARAAPLPSTDRAGRRRVRRYRHGRRRATQPPAQRTTRRPASKRCTLAS